LNSSQNIDLQSSPFRGRGGHGLEAIILAGGLGTRLRSVVNDVPKCMAPVAGKPFLYFVIEYLLQQGVDKFIFSLGYKSEVIIDYLNDQYPTLNTQYSIEAEPLGTGGAIKLACSFATEKDVLILNGDTIFKIDSNELSSFHAEHNADCTLVLKPMHHFDRYGVVELNADSSVASFKEKQFYETGLINGGIYALNVAGYLLENLPQKFSFEKEYLGALFNKRKMFGIVQDKYFIDIGIPEDFEKAQKEFNTKMIDFSKIDNTWTLFLDRDGVINHEKHKDYVHTWDEFAFYEGVPEAIAVFAKTFQRIIVVTNQKGIGKGVTKLEDLQQIHKNMIAAIEDKGGRIDAVYFCPDMDEESPNRKPNSGMGLQAVKDFPDINLNKAIMVGNTLSDMQFGRNLGVQTIFLPTTRPEVDLHDERIDGVYHSLIDFARELKNLC